MLTTFLMLMTIVPAAVIPGQADLPTNEEPPKIWFLAQNDGFGIAHQGADNYRTYGFNAGFQVQNVMVLADYSVLTNFDEVPIDLQTYKIGPRIDELTLSLGYSIHLDSVWIVPTIGIRLKGDLGGSDVQDTWHAFVSNNKPIISEYESAPNVWLAGITAQWQTDFHHGKYGCSARAVSSMTTEYEYQGAIQTLCWRRWLDDPNDRFAGDFVGKAWVGLRYDIRNGDTGTETANAVAAVESGASVICGVSLGAIQFNCFVSLSHEISGGSLGYTSTF